MLAEIFMIRLETLRRPESNHHSEQQQRFRPLQSRTLWIVQTDQAVTVASIELGNAECRLK